LQNIWDELLQKIGIAKTFSDAAQNHKTYSVDDETLRQMINCLGFSLKDIADSEQLLQKIKNKRWQYALEPIYVVRRQHKVFDIVLKSAEVEQFGFSMTDCNNKNIVVQHTYNVVETKQIGHGEYTRLQLEIISDLAPQYYNIKVQIGPKTYNAVLAVTPDKCYEPEVLRTQKIWGFAVQLYSLKSARNWGVGDFTDLQNFAAVCQRVGADVIGVNPLNVLFHDYPHHHNLNRVLCFTV
jgi:hypothetical protein